METTDSQTNQMPSRMFRCVLAHHSHVKYNRKSILYCYTCNSLPYLFCFFGSRDSSEGIVTGYGLQGRAVGFDSR
jgi:hypothetical protein